jgi:hypothetical protein
VTKFTYKAIKAADVELRFDNPSEDLDKKLKYLKFKFSTEKGIYTNFPRLGVSCMDKLTEKLFFTDARDFAKDAGFDPP